MTYTSTRDPTSSKYPTPCPQGHSACIFCIGEVRFADSLIHSRPFLSLLWPQTTNPTNPSTPGLRKTYLSKLPSCTSTIMATKEPYTNNLVTFSHCTHFLNWQNQINGFTITFQASLKMTTVTMGNQTDKSNSSRPYQQHPYTKSFSLSMVTKEP